MKNLYTSLLALLLAMPLMAQDVGIYGLAAPRFMSTTQGHNMSVLVINNSSTPATGFAVEMTVDGQTFTSSTYSGSLQENFLVRLYINNINMTSTGDYDGEVRIINNPGDPVSSNDMVSHSFSAYTDLVSRNDLVEIITGTWCGYCPYKDGGKQDVLQVNANTIFVEYHQNDALSIADGNAFIADYVGGTPRSTLNREFFPGDDAGTTMHPVLLDLAMEAGYTDVGAPVGIDVTASRVGDTLTAEISLNAVSDIPGETRLVAMLIESGIPAVNNLAQRNYDTNEPNSPLFGLGDPINDYTHDNTFRGYLNGVNGEVIGTDITANGDYSTTIEVDLTQYNLLDYDNSRIIVFAYDEGSSVAERRVINSRRLGIPDEEQVSTSEALNTSLQFAAYPNPAAEQLTVEYYLPANERVQLQLMNNLGQSVYTYDAEETGGVRQHLVNTSDLPGGIYHLSFNANGEQLTRKIVVQ